MAYNPNDPNHRSIYQAGIQAGQQSAAADVQQLIRQLQADRERLEVTKNGLAASLRREMQQRLEAQERRMQDFHAVLSALKMNASGHDADVDPVVRIENIPGKRVPWSYLVNIDIGPEVTSVRQNSFQVDPGVPFVATRRMAIFTSEFQFEFTNDVTGNTGRLAGRSYGRQRPIHSACDFNDAMSPSIADGTAWFLDAGAAPPAAGTVLPGGSLQLPSNMSSFRTMQFDGRINIKAAGSGWPRSNISVPSAFWTEYCNSPFDLSALDFFERAELVTFLVQPTHVNNPPAGNVDGECIFPAAAAAAGGSFGYPFVDGQYDQHEGICTPNAVVQGDAQRDYEPTLSDPITRLPQGQLTIGFEGYRILQGTEPGGM